MWGAATAAHQVEGNNINSDALVAGAFASQHERARPAMLTWHGEQTDFNIVQPSGKVVVEL